MITLLKVPAVYSVSLVEVEVAGWCRLEVAAATGAVVTQAMPLSSMAHVWLSGAVFKVPGEGVR